MGQTFNAIPETLNPEKPDGKYSGPDITGSMVELRDRFTPRTPYPEMGKGWVLPPLVHKMAATVKGLQHL